MATPVSPQFIPTTLDTAILNTTLADYRNRNTDNVYNENVLLNVLNAKCKEMIDGGGSINLFERIKSFFFGKTMQLCY